MEANKHDNDSICRLRVRGEAEKGSERARMCQSAMEIHAKMRSRSEKLPASLQTFSETEILV